MFPLHCIRQTLYAESLDTGLLIIRAKSFSPMTQRLAIGLIRYEQTDGRQTTIVP